MGLEKTAAQARPELAVRVVGVAAMVEVQSVLEVLGAMAAMAAITTLAQVAQLVGVVLVQREPVAVVVLAAVGLLVLVEEPVAPERSGQPLTAAALGEVEELVVVPPIMPVVRVVQAVHTEVGEVQVELALVLGGLLVEAMASKES